MAGHLLTQQELVVILGLAAAVLLALALGGGVISALKSFQVRQFQDLLFKAERKIDNLERRMFNVLNAVPVALVETDNTGKFTFANKAAHQLMGRKDSELIGLRFHSATWGITYPDGRMIPPDLMPTARALRGQTVKGFQHLMSRHGSRDKVMVSVTSMPIMNASGEIIGSSSALVEIETEQGQGVGDLTGLWRGQWFAESPLPMFGLDQAGRILDINQAACVALDFRREQMLGQNLVRDLVAPDALAPVSNHLLAVFDGKASAASIPCALKAFDGTSPSYTLTAWPARTSEHGEKGLTVMAMPSSASLSYAVTEPAPALDAATAQALSDLRQAEAARAELGVGAWHYDPESDSIVEDEGMRRLIGRTEPGGPTLISDVDQARADEAFGSLMRGDSDHLHLELGVPSPEGERILTLKGQARTLPDGQRALFGIALDTTEFAAAPPVALPVAPPVAIVEETIVPGYTEDDLDMARAEGRREALMEFSRAREEAEDDIAPVVASVDLYDTLAPVAPLSRKWLASDLGPVMGDVPESWTAFTGLDAAALTGQGWLDAVGVDDRDRVASALTTVFDTGEAATLTYAGLRADGSFRPTLERLAPVPGPDGTVDSVIGLGFDLTDFLPAAPQIIEAETMTAENAMTPATSPELAGLELEALKSRLDSARSELNLAATLRETLQLENETLRFAKAAHDTELAEARSRLESLEAELAALKDAPAAQPDLPDMSAWEARLSRLEADLAASRETQAELDAQLAAATAERDALAARLEDLSTAETTLKAELTALSDTHQSATAELDALRAVPAFDTSDVEARAEAAEARLAEVEAELAGLRGEIEALRQPVEVTPDPELTDRLETLEIELEEARKDRDRLLGELDAFYSRPAPVLDTTPWETRISALQSEIATWQDAHHDAQARLAEALKAATPTVDIAALEDRMTSMHNDLVRAQAMQAELQAKVDQLSNALSEAQRFETVGRLTGDVARDFSQMLGVVNGALEMLTRYPDNADQVRRLADSALTAARRGERLTRQLQAFNSPDEW